MRSRRRPRPRAEWEALVREWRAGGLTQREFARRKGIAPTMLSGIGSAAAVRTVHLPTPSVPPGVPDAATTLTAPRTPVLLATETPQRR